MEDLTTRNDGWVVIRGNLHGDVSCPPRPRWAEPLSAPRPSPNVSVSALLAALCQEESLPGHRGSPGAAMRRMSALSAGRAVSSDPAPNTPSPQRHASDTPTPAERRRHGNGITGAECCLFSAQCQETQPGGGQAHLPGWGREGARHWSQGSLTPSGRRHRKLRLPSQQRMGRVFWTCRS